MVSAITKLKERIVFWKELWPTNFTIYRRRADGHVKEDSKGVRLKYSDKPDSHKLRTGEKMPAIPKRYSMDDVNGKPCYHIVEADDEQLVAFKPDFKASEDAKPKQIHYFKQDNGDWLAVETEYKLNNDSVDDSSIQNLKIDTDLRDEQLEKELEKASMDIVNFSIMENKDERTTFLAEEIKSAESKYKPSSFLRQNPQLVLVVVTAIAVAIIIYATSQDYGQFVPLLKELSGSGFVEAVEGVAEQTGTPGQ